MALSTCNTTTNKQGLELVEHGSIAFPIACYHDDLSKDGVPWHWHPELEFALVTKGSTILAVDSEKIELKEGSGFFINSEVLHAAAICGLECRFHSIVFHPRLVGGSMDSVFWQKYLEPLISNPALRYLCLSPSIPWQNEILAGIETAWQSCANDSEEYEFHVRSALSHVVFLLSKHSPGCRVRLSEKTLRNEERLKLMLQYIHLHFSDELTIAQISSCAFISESECLRCFQNTIGKSPIQYVKQFRIQKAAELLVATELKIADIAAQCGFQEMSYFSKSFREAKGCTPSEFRKRQ